MFRGLCAAWIRPDLLRKSGRIGKSKFTTAYSDAEL